MDKKRTDNRRHSRISLGDIPEGAPTLKGTDVPIECLFRYRAERWNLYTFLGDFPQVSSGAATKTARRWWPYARKTDGL